MPGYCTLVTSHFGYVELRITRSILSIPLDFEITRLTCIISEPSSAPQQNPIEMAFNWHAYDGPNIECWLCSFVIFRGSRPVLLRNPIFFVIFQGDGPDPLPPLWIRTHYLCYSYILHLSASQFLLVRNPSDLRAFQDILVFLLVPPHYLYSDDNIVQW